MDKNRRIHSRHGTALKGVGPEKDRQRRPGTPMRNQRPLNAVRVTESAVPVVQLNYSDFSDEDKCFNGLDLEQKNPLHRTAEQAQSILRENSPMNAELGIAPHAESTAGTEAEPKPKDALCSEVLFRRPLATENSQLNTKSSGSIRLDSKSSSLALNEVRNQKPSVKTQATNTATTTTGLPPLEGIHAGVGFGLEKSGHYLLPTSFSLQELYDRMGAEGESKERSDRLQVPSFIFFERSSGKRRAFCGKISITNTSEYFMSFCVKTSEPELFEIQPPVGMILPLQSQNICIRTSPKYDFIFKDISGEVFKIFGTPVYTRCQMKTQKLEVLWRAFGTPMFPRIGAEEHVVNYIYQKSCTKDSLLAAISRNHRWLSSFWGNFKPVSINDNPISEEEFYQVWPLEDDNYNFLNCKNQLDGWFWHVKKAREETSRMRCEMRQCVAIFLMLLFVGIVFCSSLYPVPYSFKMAHDILHSATHYIKAGLFATEKAKHETHWDRLVYNLIHWPAFRQA